MCEYTKSHFFYVPDAAGAFLETTPQPAQLSVSDACQYEYHNACQLLSKYPLSKCPASKYLLSSRWSLDSIVGCVSNLAAPGMEMHTGWFCWLATCLGMQMWLSWVLSLFGELFLTASAAFFLFYLFFLVSDHFRTWTR